MGRGLTVALAVLVSWMLYWSDEYHDRVLLVQAYQLDLANEFQVLKPIDGVSAEQFATIAKEIMDRRRDDAAFAREALPEAQRVQEQAGRMLNSVSPIAAALIALGFIVQFALRFRFRIERRSRIEKDVPDIATA